MAYPYYPSQMVYTTPYLYPYYNSPHVSPYVPTYSLPPSPNLSPRQVHFSDDTVVPPPPTRDRRPSFHATYGPVPNTMPFPSPPMVYTPLPAAYPLVQPPPTHGRRRSDGNVPQATWVTWPTYVPPYAPQAPLPMNELHPLLDGESPDAPRLLFDLSLDRFSPMRLTSRTPKQGVALTSDELHQCATRPGIQRMKITIDAIPQWPVVLEAKDRDNGGFLAIPTWSRDIPPISLHDVLFAIHTHLQRQITHVDWARLSKADEIAISKAYTRRCRTFPSPEAFEKKPGVRRVDYLLDKYMFKGLVRSSSSQNGFDNVKMITQKA